MGFILFSQLAGITEFQEFNENSAEEFLQEMIEEQGVTQQEE